MLRVFIFPIFCIFTKFNILKGALFTFAQNRCWQLQNILLTIHSETILIALQLMVYIFCWLWNKISLCSFYVKNIKLYHFWTKILRVIRTLSNIVTHVKNTQLLAVYLFMYVFSASLYLMSYLCFPCFICKGLYICFPRHSNPLEPITVHWSGRNLINICKMDEWIWTVCKIM